MYHSIIIASFTILALVIASGADAQSVLDQVFEPDNSVISAANPPVAHAQTFTAGREGTLTSFEVNLRSAPYAGDMFWQIRSTVAGLPIEDDTTILSSGSLQAVKIPSSYSFIPFELPGAGISVQPGDVLAIVLRPAESYYWGGEWGSGTRDPYSGGSHFALLSTGNWIMNDGVDMGFRTFVQPVPEPSSAALVVISATLLLSVSRKASYLRSRQTIDHRAPR